MADQDGWILHVLRREAEGLILPDLPGFLAGTYQPRDNDERFALLGVCQFEDRPLASARLYADAFASDPKLAEDLRAGHRGRAARQAALAGCGRGRDAVGLPEPERLRWRTQARQWLRADLAAWIAMLDTDPAAVRDLARRTLTSWQADPDLSGLREPVALEGLSADEREDCLSLWDEASRILDRFGLAR